MDDEFVLGLVAKYRERGLLIDSNLLLLLMVGAHDRALIARFDRTRDRGFTVREFELLVRFADRFRKLVTTPNILTEVSNLAGQLGKQREPFRRSFRERIHLLDETYCDSRTAVDDRSFVKIGLPDAVIATVSQDSFLVLTEDATLENILASRGVDVINFNHIRPLTWR